MNVRSFNESWQTKASDPIHERETKKITYVNVEFFQQLHDKTIKIDSWFKEVANSSGTAIRRMNWNDDIYELQNHLLQTFLIENIASPIHIRDLNDIQFMLLSKFFYGSNLPNANSLKGKVDIQRIIDIGTKLSLFVCEAPYVKWPTEKEANLMLLDIASIITCYYHQGEEQLIELFKYEEKKRFDEYKKKLKDKQSPESQMDEMFYSKMDETYISLMQPSSANALLRRKDEFTYRLIPFKKVKPLMPGQEEPIKKDWQTPIETGNLFNEHHSSVITRFIPLATAGFIDYWYQTAILQNINLVSLEPNLSPLQYQRSQLKFHEWIQSLFHIQQPGT